VLTGFFRGLSPQIDQLLDAQGREPDPAKRSALVAQVSELILKGGYDIPIWPLKNPLVWDHNVSGVVFDNTNTPSFSGVSMGASR
jgi:ABC-type transport system substrate-binding protein